MRSLTAIEAVERERRREERERERRFGGEDANRES